MSEATGLRHACDQQRAADPDEEVVVVGDAFASLIGGGVTGVESVGAAIRARRIDDRDRLRVGDGDAAAVVGADLQVVGRGGRRADDGVGEGAVDPVVPVSAPVVAGAPACQSPGIGGRQPEGQPRQPTLAAVLQGGLSSIP